MADYSKLKVVDLKAELKQRGLPQTGLKQALIDRLVEDDAKSQPSAADEAPPETEGSIVPGSPAPQEPSEPLVEQATHVSADASVSEEHVEAPLSEKVSGAPEQEAQPPVAETNGHPIAAPRSADLPNEVTANNEAPTVITAQPVAQPQEAVAEEIMEDAPKDVTSIPDALQKKSPDIAPTAADAMGEASSRSQTVIPTPQSITQEEALEDSRKRKRRSHSPLPLPSETAQKRAKQEDHGAEILLHEDEESENQDSRARKNEPSGPPAVEGQKLSSEVPTETEPAGLVEGEAETKNFQDEEPPKTAGGDEALLTTEVEQEKLPPRELSPPARTSPPPRATGTGDRRLKELFSESLKESTRDKSPTRHTGAPEDEEEGEEDHRMVSPALHSATSALYVRDFMRPLQPHALKAHLISLATPPSSSPDPEILRTFFLDPIRTHCFAAFSNVSAASRVRSALHGRVWPDERTRKPLWADFVPEEKVEQWIETEQRSSGGGRPSAAKRWEVIYEPAEEDSDTIQAILQEAGAGARRQATGAGAGRGVPGAPVGPRRSEADLYNRRGSLDQGARRPSKPANTGFMALDTLFRSTTAKPKLYYLPVSKDLSEKRLDELADRLGGPGRNLSRSEDEMRRYTFEDGDLLVDRGLDMNPGRRGGQSYRGSGYGRRGGRR